MSWARKLLVAVLLLVGAVAVTVGVYFQRAAPLSDGALVLDGLRADLRIERDRHGIPSIRAGSLEDASFGLGFVHAQDRLWQLETQRRLAAGRLAEAFGESTLATDRFMRTLQVRRAAQGQWEAMSGESRRLVTAYTAGINAAIRHAMRARPPEFLMLGLTPEPWTATDSMAWAILMAWDLGGNWGSELLRLRLARRLPAERLDELLPPAPGERPRLAPDYGERLDSWEVSGLDDAVLGRLLAAAPEAGVEGVGSNNWAVDGSRSETGRPLLANDPHLRLSAPSLWYLARLVTPDFEVAGATLPGLPAVLLGQNRQLAWGFTNTGPDVQDLYLERIDPADPMRYQTPEGWARFETARETIRVRGGSEVVMQVRRSRHGPVISDAGVAAGLPAFEGPKPTYALALRWTALDPDPGSMVAMLRLQQTRSLDEFVRASATSVAPMQNMLVADREGQIGFVAAGRVPKRAPANDLMGLAPAPGWEARFDWDGFVDATATPREIAPERGWLATANQRIHDDTYPHFITSEWSLPYRQQRIESLLLARPRHTLGSFAAMQADTVSPATQQLLPWLRRAAGAHRLRAAAQHELIDFDGDMQAGRAAPLIFWAWVRQLTRGVFADEVGAAPFDASFGARSYRDALEGVLRRDDAWWCDDKATTDVQESCAWQVDAALDRALDELAARHGENVARWRWGDAHVARAEHRPFSRIAAVAGLFELRVPVGGDSYSINASRTGLRPDARTGELYLNEHGPALRALYDVADPSRSAVILSSGQSGLPFSRHYRDLLRPWARVEYLPLWPQPDEQVQRLDLRPQR